MNIDLTAKSQELLNKIVNSVYDRNPTNPNPLCFSIVEIQLVEEWLSNLLDEIKAS